MKNYKKLLSLLFITAGLVSCDFDKVSKLEDSFEIKVQAEPVFSKVNLKLYNSKDGSDLPDNAKITFSGTNADQIYTLNGNKKFKIDNGFVTVGVNRNFSVSKEAPLDVVATVTADGYIEKTRSVTFDGEDIKEEQISLLEKANLPEAITIKNVKENLSGNMTVNEIKVSITSKKNVEEVTEFTVPANTSFFDENDNPITGSSVEADFQTFDSETPDENDVPDATENPETFNGGNNEFPGGLNVGGDASSRSSVKNSINQKLDQSYLIPVTNLWCFYLYVNGKKVYRFSNPTLVRNYLFRNAFNPITNQAVKVGDVVSVYYFNRTTWKKEKLSNATVQKDGKGFYVEFTAPRAGVYPVGFEVDFNHSCATINSVKFVNNGRRSFYWYTVAHKSNPTRPIRYGYMYFNGTHEVTDSNINNWQNKGFSFLGDDMVLKMYSYSYDEGKYTVVYNQEISICELEGKTIDISNKDCFVERNMDLALECPDATYLLNNVYVYYRAASGGYWKYFDQVKNSKLTGKSPCFNAGEKYQFGFWYGGWKVTQPLTEAQMVNLYKNFDLPTLCAAVKEL